MKQAEEADIDDALAAHFAQRGIAIIEHALSGSDLTRMDELFPTMAPRSTGARAAQFPARARAWLSAHPGLLEIARRLAGGPAHMTRLQAFDKSPQANWFVPWHQDRAEDGAERAIAFLENTVALRVHLDACGEDNGPLEVVPGSHTHGRLAEPSIAGIAKEAAPALCLTERGDVLAMRPLLLHRSQRAKVPAARRVIHMEYTRSDYLEAVQRSVRAS
jgi:ectoine hydroxylase-related dioxygenase (phytanoyl-CoA dioxygenase family)